MAMTWENSTVDQQRMMNQTWKWANVRHHRNRRAHGRSPQASNNDFPPISRCLLHIFPMEAMKRHGSWLCMMWLCLAGCERRPPHIDQRADSHAHPDVAAVTADQGKASLIAQLCQLDFPAEDIRAIDGLWPFSEANPQNLEREIRTEFVFLAMGRSDDGSWIPPAASILETIGSQKVVSVAEAGANDTILSLENFQWHDDRVQLDISTYHRALGTHGSLEVEFVYSEDRWRLGSIGGCYVLPPDGGEASAPPHQE